MSKYKFYDNGNKVIAVSSYAGKVVRGVAKCDPRDSFDVAKGQALAEARCNVKVAQKRADRSEKCYEEALHALYLAEKRVDKMKNYFHDSHDALADAKAHLEEITNNM